MSAFYLFIYLFILAVAVTYLSIRSCNTSAYVHLVFAVDLLSLDGISGVELRVFACQAEQHGSFQVHPQFGVQVFLLRLTDNGFCLQVLAELFHH